MRKIYVLQPVLHVRIRNGEYTGLVYYVIDALIAAAGNEDEDAYFNTWERQVVVANYKEDMHIWNIPDLDFLTICTETLERNIGDSQLVERHSSNVS